MLHAQLDGLRQLSLEVLTRCLPSADKKQPVELLTSCDSKTDSCGRPHVAARGGSFIIIYGIYSTPNEVSSSEGCIRLAISELNFECRFQMLLSLCASLMSLANTTRFCTHISLDC